MTFAREKVDKKVPGWVQPPPPGVLGDAGGGRVVNLSGARPVATIRSLGLFNL